MSRPVELEMGLGFGAYDEDSTSNANVTSISVASPTIDTVISKETISSGKGNWLYNLTNGAVGKDEYGNAKALDLGSIIKLPEVNVKASDSQWWIIAVIIAGVTGIIVYFSKKRRK